MVKVAHSTLQVGHEAAEDIRTQLSGIEPTLLLCFASTRQDHRELARDLHHHFGGALVAGCTTAGEILTGRMLEGSAVVMAIGAGIVEKAAGAVVNLGSMGAGLDAAFKSLNRQLGQPLEELDPDTTVGVVVADGLSGMEERLIEEISERTEIPFIGGSAGDDLKFERTSVFLGGNVHQNSAILLVLKLVKGYEIVKTQSFEPTGTFLEATEVDEANRKIIAFDSRPAVYAYAEAVGAKPDDIPGSFMRYPLARMVGSEPFIRSPQKLEGTGLRFYCSVKKGEKLAVMRATDILRDTKAALEIAHAFDGEVRAIIDFHCILRALELRSKGATKEYGALFEDLPTAGFCTYGEAWTTHINQTSTMLLLK